MEKQNSLFGVEIEKDYNSLSVPERVEQHNKRLEKVKRRKGIITIHLCEYDDNSEENLNNWREKQIPFPKIKGYAVDFDGFNEGSGSPCKDEDEVNKQVEHLKEKHKDYKLEIVDLRLKDLRLKDVEKDIKEISEKLKEALKIK